MRGKFFFIVGAVISLFVFIGIWLCNPPLDAFSTIFHGSENKQIVIPIGNKGISEIKNIEVVINGNNKPDDAKILNILNIHHALEAFSLSSDVEDGEVKELEEFHLPIGTAINKRLDPDNNDTISYGLKVSSKFPVNEVTIKYRYFGIQYSENLLFN